jgi:two-component system sensor histidine kinase/response regulator
VQYETQLLDEAVLAQLAADTEDEIVPGMVETFLEELDKRLSHMERAIDNEDFVRVGNEAHTVKSGAGTFGIPSLKIAAQALEACCNDGEPSAVRRAYERVQELSQQVSEAFKNRFASQ